MEVLSEKYPEFSRVFGAYFGSDSFDWTAADSIRANINSCAVAVVYRLENAQDTKQLLVDLSEILERWDYDAIEDVGDLTDIIWSGDEESSGKLRYILVELIKMIHDLSAEKRDADKI